MTTAAYQIKLHLICALVSVNFHMTTMVRAITIKDIKEAKSLFELLDRPVRGEVVAEMIKKFNVKELKTCQNGREQVEPDRDQYIKCVTYNLGHQIVLNETNEQYRKRMARTIQASEEDMVNKCQKVYSDEENYHKSLDLSRCTYNALGSLKAMVPPEDYFDIIFLQEIPRRSEIRKLVNGYMQTLFPEVRYTVVEHDHSQLMTFLSDRITDQEEPSIQHYQMVDNHNPADNRRDVHTIQVNGYFIANNHWPHYIQIDSERYVLGYGNIDMTADTEKIPTNAKRLYTVESENTSIILGGDFNQQYPVIPVIQIGKTTKLKPYQLPHQLPKSCCYNDKIESNRAGDMVISTLETKEMYIPFGERLDSPTVTSFPRSDHLPVVAILFKKDKKKKKKKKKNME